MAQRGIACAMALSDLPCARKRRICLMTFGSRSCGTRSPLSRAESRSDGQEELAHAVARNLAAEVEKIQARLLTSSTTVSASCAELNSRSNFGAITNSPVF
jgi:hypothetical protein